MKHHLGVHHKIEPREKVEQEESRREEAVKIRLNEEDNEELESPRNNRSPWETGVYHEVTEDDRPNQLEDTLQEGNRDEAVPQGLQEVSPESQPSRRSKIRHKPNPKN
jgi:hypothetical protein